MTIALRDYQEDFVNRIREAFKSHRRVVGVASTGAGKTVCFAYITTSAASKGRRVIIAAHRVEITQQISNALTAMGVRHGRIEVGHSLTDDLVHVAMIQTLGRRLDLVREPDLYIEDECHHAVSGSYQKIRDRWQRCRILGVTATPTRTDGRGLVECFDIMVEAIPMAELIKRKFLSSYTYLAPPSKIDLSGVSKRGGDYAIDELAEAMSASVIVGDSISHYRQYLSDRPAIAFCVNIKHAEMIAAQFRSAGYRAASVDGTMEAAVRRDLIKSIGDGRLNLLTSCALISEGTDIPIVAGAILLRPTLSTSLYLQQVGRCLRTKPDGSAATVLDHVGNVFRHGMPDAPREWTLDGKKKRAAAKGITTCELCFRAFATGPGWRAEAECADDKPVGCILNVPEAAPAKTTPEVVDGELSVVSMIPSWSKGINIREASGRDWFRLLREADDEAKLREIARARGYKAGWVRHIMKERSERAAA